MAEQHKAVKAVSKALRKKVEIKKIGRPRKQDTVTAQVRILIQRGMIREKTVTEVLAENLVKRAMRSDRALDVILDRLEGKVTQPVDASVDSVVNFIIGKGYVPEEGDGDSTKDSKPDV